MELMIFKMKSLSLEIANEFVLPSHVVLALAADWVWIVII